MNYIPIIHTINDKNIFIVLREFIKTWYEIDLIQPEEEINFADRLGINLSDNINNVLNLFTDLSNSIIYGNKKYIHSAYKYIFINKQLIISYNKKDEFLFLLQEGQQDFYFGIKKNDLLQDNPIIYRFTINIKTNEMIYYEDLNLCNFIINHIFANCSKIKTRSYVYLFPKNDDITKHRITEFISILITKHHLIKL